MKKNVAGQKWEVFAFNVTTNLPVTGDATNITANLRKNHGSANAVADTNPTELEDGRYVFDISQAESNADYLSLFPESSTSNVMVVPWPANYYTTTKTGYKLASDGVDLVVIESGMNLRQALAVNTAALVGILSGAATTTITILGGGVATTRIVATVDADGNRSALTLTLPA